MMTPRLSYSQYGDFVRRAKAFQLKRLQHAPQEPAVWLVAGKAIHTGIEKINHDLMARKGAA